MGEPVKIVDLAEQLIRLSGLEPYKDIQIVFSGLRPGEKLNEELVADGENTVPTSVEKIRLVERNGGNAATVAVAMQHLVEALTAGRITDVMRAVSALVPEYVPERPARFSPPLGIRRPLLLPIPPIAAPSSRVTPVSA